MRTLSATRPRDTPSAGEADRNWGVTFSTAERELALPSIARGFGVQLSSSIEWVLIGYLVVIAAVLLTFGRLADMLGRKPLFLAGLAAFTLGSALCGAAPSLGALVAARCFQGLGAAAIFSVNVAMVTHAFRAAERGLYCQTSLPQPRR